MYCTQADILKRIDENTLLGLTAENPGDTEIDTAKVSEAITDADNIINSYAAKRYTVPFATVPGYIKTLSVDIAVYNLYTLKPTTFEADSSVKDRYDNAIKFLKLLADGKVTIGDIPEPTASPLTGGSFSADERVFKRSTMEDF